MIEYLFELDFFGELEQLSIVTINSANRDTLQLDFKILKGSNEIVYSDYASATLVFLKPDGNNVTGHAVIMADRIRYTPLGNEGMQLIAAAGRVQGQVDLYPKVGGKASTLYFSFQVAADLLKSRNISSESFIGQLEDLLAIGNATVDELKDLLETMQGQGFVTTDELNLKLSNKATKDGALQINLNSEMLGGKKIIDLTNKFSTAISLAGKDLNDIIENGLQGITDAATTINSPTSSFFFIINISFGILATANIKQIACGYNNNQLFVRYRYNTIWSAWTEYWSDSRSNVPISDNLYDLGSSARRIRNIYSGTGAIQTSDEREKENINPIDEKYIDFLMDLDPVVYKFKDDKNNEYYRMHCGLIAQEVEEALYGNELNSLDFAGLCISPIIEEVDGKKIIVGERYGLRYEEFISPLIKAFQIEKKRNNDLEKRISKLEGGL